MKLYFSNGSPFARKVRVVLAELGLAYETDILDGLRPTSSPPGPTIAIPVLEDGALRLWESDLIVDYLLRTYPAAKPAGQPPLSPWMARPEQHWQDMTVLATIATCATSIVNLRPDAARRHHARQLHLHGAAEGEGRKLPRLAGDAGHRRRLRAGLVLHHGRCVLLSRRLLRRSGRDALARPAASSTHYTIAARTRPSMLATPIGALRPS